MRQACAQGWNGGSHRDFLLLAPAALLEYGEDNMKLLLRALRLVFALVLFPATALSHADTAACQPPIAAMARMAGLPSHQFMTTTIPGAGTKNSEVVITGDTMWLLVGGRWKAIPYDAATKVDQMKRKYAAALAAGALTCARLADEASGGEVANVYTMHQATEAGTVDARIWVSAARGLPLRQVMDMPDVKSHNESHFDYINVQPPVAAR